MKNAWSEVLVKKQIRELKLIELLLQHTGSTKFFSFESLPSPPCDTTLMQVLSPGKYKGEPDELNMRVFSLEGMKKPLALIQSTDSQHSSVWKRLSIKEG